MLSDPEFDSRINHSQGIDPEDDDDEDDCGPSPDPWDFDGSIEMGWD